MGCNVKRRRDREWENVVEDETSRQSGKEEEENMDQKCFSTVQRCNAISSAEMDGDKF
jgi:hypothetical protein